MVLTHLPLDEAEDAVTVIRSMGYLNPVFDPIRGGVLIQARYRGGIPISNHSWGFR